MLHVALADIPVTQFGKLTYVSTNALHVCIALHVCGLGGLGICIYSRIRVPEHVPDVW